MISSTTGCFHCGLPLTPGAVRRGRVDGAERAFCCAGCEAAACLIEAAGLTDYYRWRSAVAPRPSAASDDLWAGYDRPEFARGLRRIDAATEVNLQLEGIRCSACGWLIEQRLRQLPGVLDVSLNPATARARVAYRETQLSTILRAVASLGYAPHVLGSADTLDLAVRERRRALKRVAVAGFGMMQVMMIAVALYESPRVGMSPIVEHYLRIASLLITTPVMLYAGAPFYAGAWRSIRARQLGMDVPVALGIVLAFGASAVDTLRGAGEIYFDSVVMFLFLLLLGRYLEMIARHRAGSAAEALGRLLPAVARRVTVGGDELVPIAALAAGDQVRIAVGEVFPADGRLATGETLSDESLITGESTPVVKRAGSSIIGGAINLLRPAVMTIGALGESTVLAGIARLLERASTERPTRALLADRIAGRFIAIVLGAAVATMLAWLGLDAPRACAATVAVLVATCPCALSLATPVAVTAAMGALAKRGVLVSRADALEELAEADCALLDKTGTLTVGQPQLVAVQAATALAPRECRVLAASLEHASGHPLARAFDEVHLLPVIDAAVVAGAGVEGWIEGRRYRIGHAAYVEALAGSRPAHLSEDGVHLGRDGEWLARLQIEDPIRPGVRAALGRLADSGLRLEIVSGDHANAVRIAAAAVGVENWQARLTPPAKLLRVRELQAAGRKVILIGDGANDAPGLGAANVSVAIGSGSALARANADLIVVGGELAVVAEAVAVARRTRRIVRENLLWAAAYNLSSLPLAALGYLPPWAAAVGMSLSSLLVVGNSLRLARAARRPWTAPRAVLASSDAMA